MLDRPASIPPLPAASETCRSRPRFLQFAAVALQASITSCPACSKSKRKPRAPKAVDGASDVTVDEAGPPAKQVMAVTAAQLTHM